MSRRDTTGNSGETNAENRRSAGAAYLLRLALATALGVSAGCHHHHGSAAATAVARYEQLGRRIDSAADSIERILSSPIPAPDTECLTQRNRVAVVPQPAEPERNAAFRLNGIVKNESLPFALTSAGAVGLGEELNGLKLVSISEDSATFMDRQGRTLELTLYESEKP